MKGVKKQSLVELAISRGFRVADENDPIYTDGWVVISSISQELERLAKEEEGKNETEE